LAVIPGLVNLAVDASVVVAAVQDPQIARKYLEPSGSGSFETWLSLAVLAVAILAGVIGRGLCCFAPAPQHNGAAKAAFALSCVAVLAGVVTLVGLQAATPLASKYAPLLLLALLVLAAMSAVSAEICYLNFLRGLGILFADHALTRLAISTRRTLFAALAIAFATGAIACYVWNEAVQQVLRAPVAGGARSFRQNQSSPDLAMPALILVSMGIYGVYLIRYLILHYRAYALIRARPH
jgi:hypothetical protein